MLAAPRTELSCVSAFRKVLKRREAVATADPYSVAVLGVGLTYLYCQGSLWYTIDDTIRLLEIRQSPTEELVVDIPKLLGKTGFASQPKVTGSFLLLHYHEGILSCLYRFSSPRQGGWLIAIDVKKRTILLSQEIASTEKLFARHDAEYLYYGIHTANEYDGRKRWVLHGYDLRTGKCLGHNNYLHDLIGADIGSTICFEIIDGFFYAVSNQTTYEVEEVDWTSFYHGRRFPLNNPSKEMLEKTEDRNMWRRQHLEGPLDDRWTSLAIAPDEATGDVMIIETRKEWLRGCSTGQRTVYKSNIVFPKRLEKENRSLQPSSSTSSAFSHASLDSSASSIPSTLPSLDSASSSTTVQTNDSSPMALPTVSEKSRRLALAALTQDRLALTVTAADKPHFLHPQIRLPKNVHSEPMSTCQRSFVLSKTPAKYYNSSANSLMDLVNDLPPGDSIASQCLRIRVCSRRLKPPVRDEDGIIRSAGRDPATGEVMHGLNEEYEDGPVTFWPPSLPTKGYRPEDAKELHDLMNPPAYIGKVHGTFDDSSLVYVTGKESQPKAIIFVSFDPSIKLHGLKKWRHSTPTNVNAQGQGRNVPDNEASAPADESNLKISKANTLPPDASSSEEDRMPPRKRRKTGVPHAKTGAQSTCAHPRAAQSQADSAPGNGWVRSEPAKYLSIARGYDFGL